MNTDAELSQIISLAIEWCYCRRNANRYRATAYELKPLMDAELLGEVMARYGKV